MTESISIKNLKINLTMASQWKKFYQQKHFIHRAQAHVFIFVNMFNNKQFEFWKTCFF